MPDIIEKWPTMYNDVRYKASACSLDLKYNLVNTKKYIEEIARKRDSHWYKYNWYKYTYI